jgi:hypothetical protein
LVKLKKVDLPDIKIDSKDKFDWIEMKTEFAHSSTNNENKNEIDKWIKEENE